MKTQKVKYVLTFVALALIACLSNCKCGPTPPAPTKPDERTDLLKNLAVTWKVTDVKLDNLPRTDFPNFTLTLKGADFNNFAYETAGRPADPIKSPWKGKGTFTFGADPKKKIVRDDKTEMEYTINGANLKLTFTFDNVTGYGANERVSEVKGVWEFNFTNKQ